MLFLDNISVLQLFVPAMCSVTMCVSNVVAKKPQRPKEMHNSFVLGRTFSDSSNQAKVVTLKQCGASSKVSP